MTHRTSGWIAVALLGAGCFASVSCSKSFQSDDNATGGATGGSGGASGTSQGGTSGTSAGKGGGGTPAGGASGTSTSGGEAGAGADSTGGTGTGGSSGGSGGSAGTPPEGGAGTGPGTPTYRDVVLADHPLVYWRMGISSGQSVPDETGGDNALILQGTGHALGQAGAIRNDDDTAMGFDGIASYAIATDARVLDFADRAPFTLECWARWVSGSTGYFQHLFSNIVGSPGDRNGYVLYLIPEPDMATNQRSSFEYDRPTTEVPLWGPVAEEATWAHYVAVVDGTTAKLYVNGNLESTAVIDAGFAARSGPFAVARGANESGNHFKGDLDEMAVYARALGIADVVEHYGFLRR